MTGHPVHSTVLVVGGGPSGMMLAILLGQAGVDVTVVERHPTRRTLPKAHVVNPVTLEICRQAGLDMAELLAQATPAADDRVARMCDRLVGRDIGVLPFEVQDPSWVAHRRINIAQPRLEALLERHARGVAGVRWVVGSWEGGTTGPAGCVSRVRTDAGEIELTSDYLVGADGANSRVRDAFGIVMTGPGEVQEAVSVHFRNDLRPWLRDRPAGLFYCLDPTAAGGFVAHDIDGEWVYVWFPQGDEPRDLDASRERLRRAIGVPSIEPDIVAISPWRLASRSASAYRSGPLFLLGDAAHQLPPTGGLGLNTGVQDAANLAWKIAAVVAGWAQPGLLDSYESERRPVAEDNMTQSLANAKTMGGLVRIIGGALADGTLGELSDREVAALLDSEWVGLNSPGLQLGYVYGRGWPAGQRVDRYEPLGIVGARVPHVDVLVDGSPVPVHDLFDHREFVLLVEDEPQVWKPLVEDLGVPVRVRQVLPEDVTGARGWHELMGLRPGTAVLVRPDGHIAGRTTGPTQALAGAVAAHLGAGTLFPTP